MASYRVNQAIRYGTRQVDAGEIADDIPATSVRWLTEQGIIEKVDEKPKKTTTRKAEED